MALTKISSNEIQTGAITSDLISANVSLGVKISNVSIANSTYSIINDTVVDTSGGYIIVTGVGFNAGAQVIIGGTNATSVTRVSSTELRVEVPSNSAATYNLYVVNTDGSTGIRVNALTYSATPTWVTSSTLTNWTKDVAANVTFSATYATSYANTTTLPAGTTLLSNGYFYGTITGITDDTAYNFTIRASDNEGQYSDRTFTLNALVPAVLFMGYTAGLPAGVTITQSSAVDGPRPGSKMFDNSLDTEGGCWHSSYTNGPHWVVIDFGATSRKVKKYLFMHRRNGGYGAPSTYQFQGSNDNSNWTVLDSQTNNPPPNSSDSSIANNLTNGLYKEITLGTTGTYRYYRFYVTQSDNTATTPFYAIVGEMLIYI